MIDDVLKAIDRRDEDGNMHFHVRRTVSKVPHMSESFACTGRTKMECHDALISAEVGARLEERLRDLGEDVMAIAYPEGWLERYAEEKTALKG